jgi:hypothetical protein
MPRISPLKSKYHGIYLHKGIWLAKLTIDGKQKVVGSSIWEGEAARQYKAALIHYGITNMRPDVVSERQQVHRGGKPPVV